GGAAVGGGHRGVAQNVVLGNDVAGQVEDHAAGVDAEGAAEIARAAGRADGVVGDGAVVDIDRAAGAVEAEDAAAGVVAAVDARRRVLGLRRLLDGGDHACCVV